MALSISREGLITRVPTPARNADLCRGAGRSGWHRVSDNRRSYTRSVGRGGAR